MAGETGLFVIEGSEGIVFIEGGDEVIFISERGDPGAAGPVGGLDVEDRLSDVETATADVEEGLSDLSDVVSAAVAVLEQADTDEAAARDSADEGLQDNIDAEGVLREAQTAALAAANVAQDAARAASEAAIAATVAAETVRALAAEDLRIPKTWRGAANGVASLDANATVPLAQLPGSLASEAEVAASLTAEQVRADAYADAAAAQAKADLIDGAPELMNALSELAEALGNDPEFATTITALIGTKQDGSAQLSALAGLVFAANEMVYSTGPGAFAKTALTAAGRTFLSKVNAAEQREAMGLGDAALADVDDFDPAGAADAAEAAAIAASQPASALLTLLAGLAPAANQFPYFTAANAVAMADVTVFARTLLDDVSAVAMRATLGAETAGAAAAAQAASQPLAALLTNLIALAPGANTFPYINGAGAWAAQSVTAFARTLLDDANAADARATLGITLGVANPGDVPTRADADARYSRGALLFFGDGSDGAVVLDGAIAPAWATKVGNVYTLTRTIACTDLTVNAGVTLIPDQYPVYCTGTLTNNGLIQSNGKDAAANVAGGTTPGNHMLGGSQGGAGGAVGGGVGANGTARTSLGGRGGDGGAGVGAKGNGGTVTAPPTAYSAMRSLLTYLATAFLSPQIGPLPWAGGTGGGGGGGSTAATGGGGAGAGGVIALICRHIVNGGAIEAKGGIGGNAAASATNGGGGGGGGGGFIVTLSEDAYSGAGTWSVVGGAKGNKVNAGVDGNNGADGLIVRTLLAA